MSGDDNPDPIAAALAATASGVIGQAPALAMAQMYQVAAQATALTLQNQAAAQQGVQQLGVAAVSAAITQLMTPPQPPAAPVDASRVRILELELELAKAKAELARLTAQSKDPT